MRNPTRATLTVEADIDLNGLAPADLEYHLRNALVRAIGNGLLTGDTPAEVDEYHTSVSVIPATDKVTSELDSEGTA